MVLRDVEHDSCGGLKTLHTIELKAGQLQHPGLGQILCINAGTQGIEQRRANVARHGGVNTSMLQQLARERSDRGLAVGAGNGQHFGLVTVRCVQPLQGCGKQIQLTAHRQPNGARCIHDGGNGIGRQAGGAIDRSQALAINQSAAQRATNKPCLRQLCAQQLQLGRRFACISHRDLCARSCAPACHRDARCAQT